MLYFLIYFERLQLGHSSSYLQFKAASRFVLVIVGFAKYFFVKII